MVHFRSEPIRPKKPVYTARWHDLAMFQKASTFVLFYFRPWYNNNALNMHSLQLKLQSIFLQHTVQLDAHIHRRTLSPEIVEHCLTRLGL